MGQYVIFCACVHTPFSAGIGSYCYLSSCLVPEFPTFSPEVAALHQGCCLHRKYDTFTFLWQLEFQLTAFKMAMENKWKIQNHSIFFTLSSINNLHLKFYSLCTWQLQEKITFMYIVTTSPSVDKINTVKFSSSGDGLGSEWIKSLFY